MIPINGTVTLDVSLAGAILAPFAFTLAAVMLAGVWRLAARIHEEVRRMAARDWEAHRELALEVPGDERAAA